MNTFDLQIQSTASDGAHTSSAIMAMAEEVGLSVIALTDHDTVAGVGEAYGAGKAAGIRVIPGIEISAEERGVHILGYGIDPENPDLLRALDEAKNSRLEGAKKMAENLARAGFVISWEDVAREATGAVVARPHLARAILHHPENKEKLAGVATVHDFIQAYLTDESPYYVRRAHITVRDAVSLIHGAGGVATWSHPAIHFGGNTEDLEQFLQDVISWGIDGVEVFNPSHTEDDTELLHGLALKYLLLRTAGSDFHEVGNHPADPRGLHSARAPGDYETYGFPTDDIISLLDAAITKRILRRD